MESVAEVLRVVGAIVSAFQAAADTLEFVKERKEKKKRKKDRELEELLEIKILHKSLVEGGTRCRKHCENRHQQFGSAFEIGDALAIPALKEVVISIQSEIIQALNLARAVDNAVLDFTALHESSVTGRKDATRAMDQLCQRIMASMQVEPKSRRESVEATTPSASSLLFSYANMQPSEGQERFDTSFPSLPSAMESPPPSVLQRTLPDRTFTVRQHNGTALRTSQKSGSLPLPESRALKVTNLQGQQADNDSLVSRPISSLDQEQQPESSDDLEVEDTSKVSIRDSGLGSDRSSEHLHIMKTASVAKSIELQRAPIGGIAVHQHPLRSIPPPEPKPPTVELKLRTSDIEQHDYGTGTPDLALHTSDASPTPSLTATPLSARISRIEKPEDVLRALEAPEVVTKDFGVMFSMRPIASAPTTPASGADKYLAFRTQSDYAEALFSLSPGMDNIWAPLSRPAMHNRYHGFCKGAWQMRKAVSTLCGVRPLLELFILVADLVLCEGA
ncbi:uncharacterized protein A1O5_03883 [Cladophialophora psammophila CBS 110553]|uniref:Uncharacterized protein n=1 Tax=Cladophialophora psammophila CBS 110553 TaxID=1182543 RepID=W9X732_9EURO|nr:uncharacterized protein A1O5_03883 [Cladophialophora psammophila CBS 110553]EXJ72736.1 hypothetical protein A1O5_03883 [Cladophialophora psammophila CBS 110553]